MTWRRLGGIALAVLSIATTGCVKGPEPVYVDLVSIPTDLSSVQVRPPALTFAEPGASAESIPPAPEERFSATGDSATSLEIERSVLRRISRARELARKQILAGLLLKLDAQEEARRNEVLAQRAELLSHAYDETRQIFEPLADAHFPIRNEIANLVGYGPTTHAITGHPNLVPVKTERYKRLQSDQGSLDRAFEDSVQSTIERAVVQGDQLLATIRTRRALDEDAAYQSAEAQANKLFASTPSEGIESLMPVLAEMKVPAMPATSVRAVRLSSVQSPTPKLAPVSEVLDLPSLAQIWAESHGYKLVPKGQGRDLTEEFRTWRANHRNGR